MWRVLAESEVADADGAVRVNAEDFVKGEHGSGRSRDDRAANDTHFALVNVAAPDGEPAGVTGTVVLADPPAPKPTARKTAAKK